MTVSESIRLKEIDTTIDEYVYTPDDDGGG